MTRDLNVTLSFGGEYKPVRAIIAADITLAPSAAYMSQWVASTWVQMMALSLVRWLAII